ERYACTTAGNWTQSLVREDRNVKLLPRSRVEYGVLVVEFPPGRLQAATTCALFVALHHIWFRTLDRAGWEGGSSVRRTTTGSVEAATSLRFHGDQRSLVCRLSKRAAHDGRGSRL